MLPYVASGALGIIVGWLIWTFVHRTTDLTVKAITSLATLAAGGVVIGVWPTETEVGDAVFAYPIGALIAIVLLGLLKMADEPDGDSSDKPEV